MLEYSEKSEEWVKSSQSTARVSSLFICLVCGVPEDMLEYCEKSEEWMENSQSTPRVSSLFICLVCGIPEDMLEYSEKSEEWVKNSQYPASAAGYHQARDLYALPVTLKGLGHEIIY